MLPISPLLPPVSGVAAIARIWIGVVLVCFVFFGTGLYRLDQPSHPIFDEQFFAKGAMEVLKGGIPTEQSHPPLSFYLVAAGVHLSGGQIDPAGHKWQSGDLSDKYPAHAAFSWRLSSLCFGTGCLVLLYLLGSAMFNNPAIGLLAAVLLALDGVFFVQSRAAMTNIFGLFFMLLGTLGAWHYAHQTRHRWIVLAGLGFGLDMACRWTGVVALGLAMSFLFAATWARTAAAETGHPGPFGLPWVAPVPLARATIQWAGLLAAIVVMVYLLAFTPLVIKGEGGWWPSLFSMTQWHHVYEYQVWMWQVQHAYHSINEYTSAWWTWPLVLRPTLYAISGFPSELLSVVICIGNVAIWWASVPALCYAAWSGLRERHAALTAASFFGFGLWLFWALVSARDGWLHYMLEAIPFACLALAAIIHRLWHLAPDRVLTPNAGKGLAVIYLSMVIGWFAYFHPLLTYEPVSYAQFIQRMWFGERWYSPRYSTPKSTRTAPTNQIANSCAESMRPQAGRARRIWRP